MSKLKGAVGKVINKNRKSMGIRDLLDSLYKESKL